MVRRQRKNILRAGYCKVAESPARRSVLLGLAGLVGTAAVLPLAPLVTNDANARILESKPGDVTLGNADAPIVVIEYFSLSCPHCGAFHKLIFPEINSAYIETGKVRFVFRDFPLNWPAVQAAILTHCAEPTQYFALQSALFDGAPVWNAAESPLLEIAKIGKDYGVDRAQFQRCLEDEAIEKQVFESFQFARDELGVNGTPTFYINGEKYTGGVSFKAMAEKFDELLSPSK